MTREFVEMLNYVWYIDNLTLAAYNLQGFDTLAVILKARKAGATPGSQNGRLSVDRAGYARIIQMRKSFRV